MKVCKECHWWENKFPLAPLEQAFQGRCHRYPPPRNDYDCYADDWCGEWKEREEELT